MIIAGTGHRTEKLFPDAEDPYSSELFDDLMVVIQEEIPEETELIISGMALGFDQALAATAFMVGIPFIAAIPFKGFHETWPIGSRNRYASILENASQVVEVSYGDYKPWKMQRRNEWMVDRCDTLLAMWDRKPNGGTYNCIKYAMKMGRDIRYISTEHLSVPDNERGAIEPC